MKMSDQYEMCTQNIYGQHKRIKERFEQNDLVENQRASYRYY